jgi:transcriptional regulator with XRE-family HTH domain
MHNTNFQQDDCFSNQNNHIRLDILETIGERVSRLRVENGWTQQAIAARISISRVAISHIEMNLILPSERTVILLAGIFKISPIELVNGTSYPKAKGERLPDIACCYTRLEVELIRMNNDLEWLERIKDLPIYENYIKRMQQKWYPNLTEWYQQCCDERERALISKAKERLALVNFENA